MKNSRCVMAVVGICNAILIGSAEGGKAADFSNWYLKSDLGMAFQSDLKASTTFVQPGGRTVITGGNYQCQPGIRFHLAAGCHFPEPFAVEFETGVIYCEAGSQQTIAIPGGRQVTEDVRLDYFQVPFLANLVFNVPLQSRYKPFIGVGLGGVWSVLQDVNSGNIQMGYQGTVGIRYEISSRARLGLVYMVLETVGEGSAMKPAGHVTSSFGLTLTYSF